MSKGAVNFNAENARLRAALKPVLDIVMEVVE